MAKLSIKILSLTALMALVFVAGLANAQVLQNPEPDDDIVGPPAPQQTQTAEEVLAERRGDYTKTQDTEAAECEVEAYETSAQEPGGGSGLFVPVHEIGMLLSLAEDTNRLTGESRALALEICMQLKAIRRIAYEFEEKELVDDINARKSAFQGIAAESESTAKRAEESRADSPISTGSGESSTEQKTSVIDKNQNDTIKKEVLNEREVVKDELRNSSNFDKENIETGLTVIEDLDPLASSLSETEIDELINSDQTPLTSDEYWIRTLELAGPGANNTTRGSYNVAMETKLRREALAEQNLRDEYQAGQGFLSSRKCLTWTSTGGACTKWQTLTPGSIIKDYFSALTLSPLRQAEQANEVGEDFVKGELPKNQESILGAEGITTLGRDSIAKGADPAPAPDPYPSTGWANGGTGTTPGDDGTVPPGSGPGQNPVPPGSGDNLPGDNTPPGNNNPPTGGNPTNPPGDNNPGDDTGGTSGGTPKDNTGDGDYNDDADDADGDGKLNSAEPGVWLFANTSTDRTKTILTWYSRNSSQCVADNDWVTKGAGNTITLLKKKGDSVGTKSATAGLTVNHPINLGVEYLKNEAIYRTTSFATSTSLNGLIETANIYAPGAVDEDDVYKLTFRRSIDQTPLIVQAGPDIAQGDDEAVLNAFQAGIIYSQSQGYLSYIRSNLARNSRNELILDLQINPTFKIKCTSGTDVATAEKTLQ